MTLRHPIATLSLLLTVFGCAGVTEYMPRGGSAADSAQVVILRNRNPFGSLVPSVVMFDEKAIAKLRVGQYIQFWVPPGRHSVRTTGYAMGDSSVALEFQLGESYYFVISPVSMGSPGRRMGGGLEVEPWPADRARESMEKYRRLEAE